MAPAVLYLLLFSIYPLFYSVNVAFTTTTTAGSAGFTLANFTRLAHDRLFFISLLQTAIFTMAALAIEFVAGLTLALAADSAARHGLPFLKQVRALLLIPMLLPPVVAAVVWRLIYNPDFGVLNGTLKTLGVDTSHLTWIAGESSAMLSVIVVDVWQWTPLMFLLLLAGLQALPIDLRGRRGGRRDLLADALARNTAPPAAGDSRGHTVAGHGSAAGLRFDFHSHQWRTGIRHRNRQLVHLSHRVPLLRFRLRRGAFLCGSRGDHDHGPRTAESRDGIGRIAR